MLILPIYKNYKKLVMMIFLIPDVYEFLEVCKYNYRVIQLKTICKHYELKSTGTKK